MDNTHPAFLPKWRKHSKYNYGKQGVTVRSQHATGQRIVSQHDDDGETKFVSVPHQPYERWIDPAGFVCPLLVSPNRLAKEDPTYAATMKAQKTAAGWLPYDSLPAGSGLTMKEWEIKREEVIQERQTRRARHEAAYAKAFQAREELIANKTGEELAKAIRSIGPAIVDAVDQMDQKRTKRAKAE